MQHHEWHDPLLCAIRDFHRPQALITNPQPPPTATGAVPDTACLRAAGETQSSQETSSELSFDKAVGQMLSSLARSVAVRCQCIDQHPPHKQSVTAPAAVMSQSQPAVRTADIGNDLSFAGSRNDDIADGTETELLQSAAVGLPAEQSQAEHQHQCSSSRSNLGAHLQEPMDTDGSTQYTPQLPQQAIIFQQQLQLPPAASQSETALELPQTTQCPTTGKQMNQSGAEQAGSCKVADLPPAPVLILFSGGVDSTLIAAMAHQALPVDVPIDLASVCFNGGKSADRLAAVNALEELADFAPAREWRLIQVDSSLQEVDKHKDWLLGKRVVVSHHWHKQAP